MPIPNDSLAGAEIAFETFGRRLDGLFNIPVSCRAANPDADSGWYSGGGFNEIELAAGDTGIEEAV